MAKIYPFALSLFLIASTSAFAPQLPQSARYVVEPSKQSTCYGHPMMRKDVAYVSIRAR